MPQDIIIAIDGLASSGKSTVARQLAEALNYSYVDSGAFYRAVTLYFLKHQVDWNNPSAVAGSLPHISIAFVNHRLNHTLLNGENVETEIRSIQVAESVSKVSTVPEVRSFISEKLRGCAKGKRIVMDGRDIGTVVFPDAEMKIYLTADELTRSERRYAEMKKKGSDITRQQVAQNLLGRDHTDRSRTTAPLKIAQDAIVIDNTHLSLQQQFEMVHQLAIERISK